MWLCLKRAIGAAERNQQKYENTRARIAKAGKVIREVDQHAEENTAKITDLSSKLAEAEKALMEAQEVKAAAKVAREAASRSRAMKEEEAKKMAVIDCQSLEEFTVLLEKEVMELCEDLTYRFKRYNADKKLNMNFLRNLPQLPEGVTKEMVEA